jgi:Cd2+/Zn2+-exporting ATPase/Cu+-exporting ATPase
MANLQTIEVPVEGMDCMECTQHVRHAIAQLPGVSSVEVLLTAQKAVVQLEAGQVDLPMIRKAVEGAGYSVPQTQADTLQAGEKFTRKAITTLALVVGVVLFVIVVGEGFGLFAKLTDQVPFWLGALVVVVGGLPIFIDVVRSALHKQVTSRTLMSLGVLAALAVHQWTTAGVVVFMMHIGNYVESFTADRSRKAITDLSAMTSPTARVERAGAEIEVPLDEVKANEVVVVRPGERIPVDGMVLTGNATINQAALTGESMPVEAGTGSKVYAATVLQLGSIRIQTVHVGRDSAFGRVIQLVGEAEAKRGEVQRFADKFSGYYLPVVAGIALLTLVISGNPLNATAVLVVACSCSIALATPIAMLASIGAGAKQGVLVKGGKFLELLARADVVLLDKTGTLTLGKPRLTEVISLNGVDESTILTLAASAERYSEHPLARALREAASERQLHLLEVQDFAALPGRGVRAQIDGCQIAVGSQRIVRGKSQLQQVKLLEQQGRTLLYLEEDGELVGLLAATDTLRPEVPAALKALKALKIGKIELLTGDNAFSASELGKQLGIDYRANLLPEDKINAVKEYQAQGHTVVMVGDGINDAPALAQADVGIAMGASGTDIALEAADVALLRDDWNLMPSVFKIARRTMGVVKMNLILTAIYNIAGISLAAFGIIPPVLAAALQSLPDLGILGNSSRLFKIKD